MSDCINRTSYKSLRNHSEKNNIKLIILEEKNLEEILIKDNCKAIGIMDKNLANAVRDNIGVGVNE